ncbi:hypothetical protein CD790_27725 [Streptomyces sp. SAJ15]|nr:hypothetical protein CD790_27725 [Streptomyces sp. SAJ15]
MYLLHLKRSEVRAARHWQAQAAAPQGRDRDAAGRPDDAPAAPDGLTPRQPACDRPEPDAPASRRPAASPVGPGCAERGRPGHDAEADDISRPARHADDGGARSAAAAAPGEDVLAGHGPDGPSEQPRAWEEPLRAGAVWASPPISSHDLAAVGGPRRSEAGASAHCHGARADALCPALAAAVGRLTVEEDADLGEVVLPGPRFVAQLRCCAALLARRARTTTRPHSPHRGGEGGPPDRYASPPPGPPGRWSPLPLRAPSLTHAAQQVPRGRPAPGVLEPVHRALRVLEVIGRYSGGVSGVQIAHETGLSEQALARAIQLLLREGFALRIATGYLPGPTLRLLGTGGGADAGHRQLRHTLAVLRDTVGAAVYVSRYADGEVAVTQYADGPGTPRVNEWVDFRAAAHASAVGKCLLTQLDYDGRMDHLARHRAARLTSRTITSHQRLFQALDSRPPAAPVLDLQEYALGTVCAAVPIGTGPAATCVALSLPAEHAARLPRAAETLRGQAATVLLSLLLSGAREEDPSLGAASPGVAERPLLTPARLLVTAA